MNSIPGVWNSSRIAAAVEDTEFYAVITPSQPGIISGGANTEEMNPSGNATANNIAEVSVFLTQSPRNMPTKISASQNQSSKTMIGIIVP